MLGVIFYLILLISCQQDPTPFFKEIESSHSGVTFRNHLTETPELNILSYLYYYNGAGVLAADFNNDSLPDLYFAGNQHEDGFYLNQGGLKFRDVAEKAGLANSNGWTTGVTHVDINGDGLLDLYICKASGYRTLKGKNLLYVNQGITADGIPVFKEKATEYGLDFSGLSTQAAFFDYDLDGDLDLFLVNHSVHPNRNYGKGAQRESFDPISGDRLYKNENGYFVDISQEAGIFQGRAGYGLGLGISDINNDGYPDIYVGNDFFENDYLYINSRDGTFKEVISREDEWEGHTTHFSMGNDLADINNDGLVDIISLDMLPEDLLTYKTSGLEYAYPIYRQYLRNGFAHQYMQNTLQLNLSGGDFAEIGFLSGIAATEWSWGGLLADFDNDGYKDLFVTNGIKGATNDMDYMNFIANEDIQRRIDKGMQDTDMPLTREIPAKKVSNYIFKNNGDLSFTDQTDAWIGRRPTFSNGSVYADLDRDGDLDLVVNHVNEEASILENTLSQGNSLRLSFKGSEKNTKGIGARILAYTKQGEQVVENFSSRGYLSAVPAEVHLGVGAIRKIDSLVVIWPGGAYEKFQAVAVGSEITLSQRDASGNYFLDHAKSPKVSWRVTDSILPFQHRENTILDFDREPLIPFANSNEGPSLSITDINRDGFEDLFISGAKRQSSALFIQSKDGSFQQQDSAVFAPDAISEDTGHVFMDADGDGWKDLIVVSGGNEFSSGNPVQPRMYRNRKGHFQKDSTAFAGFAFNASGINTLDIDLDGDLDVMISAGAVAGAFGKDPRHGLFKNDGNGNFTEVSGEYLPDLQSFGSIKDFKWADIDGDGLQDLVVSGHWTPITVFKNEGTRWKRIKNNGLDKSHGWWNCLELVDIDLDGDLDIIGGNWGLNSKFRASEETPVRLYRKDFDQNGSEEPLVTYFHKGVETPFASRDELSKQMPFLNKKFRTYKDFAKASLDDLFGRENLQNSVRKQVYELASCLFLNDGAGHFQKSILPPMAQASAVYDYMSDDFNGDGYKDLLIVGNLHEISTQLGRLDAFHGLILKNNTDGSFSWAPELTPNIPGAGREVDTIRIQSRKIYVIGRNDGSPLFITQDEK